MTDKKYSILFIDEEAEKRRDFMRYAENDFEVSAIHPLESIEDMIEYILQNAPQSIILDHMLNEKDSSISYNGADLAKKVLAEKTGFPCFILTSHAPSAVNEADDVNIVYSKDALEEETGKVTLNEKIKIQIAHYIQRISNAEIELNSLIEKAAREQITGQEEARLIELDTFLERSNNNYTAIPNELKTMSHMSKLGELITISEQLLKTMKKD